MFKDLSGKVAIVTGGGQGIGAAIVRVFAGAGAKVLIATRTGASGDRVAAEVLAAGGDACCLPIDIGAKGAAETVVAATVEAFGGLDVMVHNAASFLGGPIESFDEDDLETALAVNLKACFRLTRAAIPELRRRGGGRLLFTSSVTGPRVAMPGAGVYGATKGGVNAFIRTAALELARENITVNGVEPGFIRTPAMEHLADAEGLAQMARHIPMGELGAPEDIAWPMLFLASAEARYITGQTIVVDGGSTLPESPVFLEEADGVTALGG